MWMAPSVWYEGNWSSNYTPTHLEVDGMGEDHVPNPKQGVSSTSMLVKWSLPIYIHLPLMIMFRV